MTDYKDNNSILSFYKTLPDKPDTTIRFFNRGDFYTVLGPDATYVAKEVFKSTNNIKMVGPGDDQCEWLSLNKNQFNKLVRDLLLVHQYRVEVYEGHGSDWSLEYKGSPGNLAQFEDLIYNLDESDGSGRTVMAIKKTGKLVGVCTVTVEQNSLCVCEMEDDEAYTGLEGLLVQVAPKELLLSESADPHFSKIVKRFGCPVTSLKSSSFTSDGLESGLNRLLAWQEGQSENCLALPQLQYQVASAAMNAAINYTELINDEMHHNKFTLSTLTPGQFVHLDASAARALGLYAGPGSLVKHLDRCRTPPGKRLLSVWVKQPLRDVARINERLEMVEVLIADTELRTQISDEYLRGFPDLEMLARRVNRKAASLQDCYKVYQAMKRMRQLLEALELSAGQSPVFCAEIISPIKDYLEQMNNFEEMVTETLDFECADRGEFLVKSTFSEELGALREQIDELTKKLERDLSKCASMLGLEAGKSVKLESNAQLGYFFRTTNKKVDKAIRDNGMKIVDSTKAGLRFRSVAVEKFSGEVMNLKQEYDSCQKTIVQEIVNIAAGYSPSILSLSQTLAKLDVLTSFSVVSVNAPIPYVRPKVLPSSDPATSGKLKMTAMRHPVMETLDSVSSFIPNDIDLSHGGKTFEVITGPNMGGKSTYLRTVGTCAVLAHIGCFVPCDDAELTVLDAILARVGASDCQMAGVSTFMNEMVETSAILKRGTAKSLVLIDELGRGTSTYEGCGLAWAIARRLAEEMQAFSLFATHFQEITLLEKEVTSVRNRHVSAVTSEDGLTLLYQLNDGASDRSFGIEVARAAKLPPHVIENARKKLVELEQRQGLGISGVTLTKEEVEEGELLVIKFLQEVLSQGVDKLPQIKDALIKQQHRYIDALLS